MVQAGTQWWLCQWLPPSSAGAADPTPAQGRVAPEPSSYTPNPAPHPCPSHTAQLPFTARAPLLPCPSPSQALPTHALLQTPLLLPCSPALVTRPAAVKAGWAGGGGHHPPSPVAGSRDGALGGLLRTCRPQDYMPRTAGFPKPDLWQQLPH